MVSVPAAIRAILARDKLANFLTRSVGANGAPISQRELMRLTGFPRTTLQDFLASPERRRLSTVERIERLLTDPRLQIARPGQRTIRMDAPAWSRDSLGALQKPEGARGFAFIYTEEGYASGVAQTMLSAVATENPDEAIGMVPGGADSIVSVLWYVG